MKYFIFFSFLAFSLQVTAQSKNEYQVRQLLDKQSAAWNKGDIESFMIGYQESDSLMFIGKSGITYGWMNTLNNYKKSYPDTASMGKLTFNLIVMKQLSSQYFFVVGKWHLKRSIGNVEGHFTLLFKKIKKRWAIVADHSS